MDHWVKNVFVLPGIVAAVVLLRIPVSPSLMWRIAVGLLGMCVLASSYYTLNEILDAPFDICHPTKCRRPVPSGRVHRGLGYLQWLVLGWIGMFLGYKVDSRLFLTFAGLWMMGILYNVPPIRVKDLPYLDVISEAVNNPLRLLAGWFIAAPTSVPPLSMLLSYWFVGCYFMAIKRLAEFREMGDPAVAAAYRKSFRHYSERRLLCSIQFHGSAAMLCFGALAVRYRLEWVLTFPLVALVMALYLDLAFDKNSAAQAPERLHREPRLMAAVAICAAAMVVLLIVDLPGLHDFLAPGPTVQR